MYSNPRSTTPDSAAMLAASLRHVQFSRQQQLVRRPSFADLGDQDEGYWDEQDEQREDEPFYYDYRDDSLRQGQRGPSPTPPAEKDHMNRFTTRRAPEPRPQHFVPVERQQSGSRPAPTMRAGSGGSVKAAVSKFQYRADANGSSSSLMLPKTHSTGGSAPIPILRQNTGQYGYRAAGPGSSASVPTRMALSAPTGNSAMGMAMGMNPAMNDSRDSLLRTNPNLKLVGGELRMSVFPERKRSADAGMQLVHRRRGSGSTSPDSTEADITEMAARDRMRIEELERERDSLRAELARRPQSPEPAPVPAPAETRAQTQMGPRPSVPSMAPPSVTKAVSSTFRPAPAQSYTETISEQKALVSPKALVARNFVASIVSELKSSAKRAPPPPPPAATKPKAASSKWAPVDTSAGLKRKWQPGSHVPSTLRSYVHLLSGGAPPHALGRMGSAN